jgi:hypothetical protein
MDAESSEHTEKSSEEQLIALGRMYTHEFIGTLAETANETLWEWLKDQGAPEELILMIDEIVRLKRFELQAKFGNFCDAEAAKLAHSVPVTTQLIARFGGSFRSKYGISKSRKPSVLWPLPNSAEQSNN